MKRLRTESQAIFNRADRIRSIAYWTCTLLVAFENAAGWMWVFLGVEYPRVILAHLGYPQYLQNILGPCELACAAALLAPRLPRVKEWAYAGAFFKYSSAFVSLLLAGDRPDIGAALVPAAATWAAAMAALTIASWALRPPDRRLAESTMAGETTVWSWVTSAVVLGLMLVLSVVWLPKATGLV